MIDIQLTDVTLHIGETLEKAKRSEIEEVLRGLQGVVSVHNPDDKPHLAIVEYNPDQTDSQAILATVTSQDVHAKLIGL